MHYFFVGLGPYTHTHTHILYFVASSLIALNELIAGSGVGNELSYS